MNKEIPSSHSGNAPPPTTMYPSPYPQDGPPHQQPQENITVVTPLKQPNVVVIGGCPTCRVGLLEDKFGCCAICLALSCFPVGLVCCYLMREKKCTNCGEVFNQKSRQP